MVSWLRTSKSGGINKIKINHPDLHHSCSESEEYPGCCVFVPYWFNIALSWSCKCFTTIAAFCTWATSSCSARVSASAAMRSLNSWKTASPLGVRLYHPHPICPCIKDGTVPCARTSGKNAVLCVAINCGSKQLVCGIWNSQHRCSYRVCCAPCSDRFPECNTHDC